MSDRPERGIAVMRRQLEMLLDYDDSTVTAILEAADGEAIANLDLDLDDEDTRILRQMDTANRDDLFDVSENDAEVLYQLSNQIQLLGEAEYGAQRHEFLLRRNFSLAKEVGGLATALDDRDVAEEIVRHINTHKAGSPETNKDYRTAFRMFGEILTEDEGKPESIEWVPGGYPSNYDPAPRPEEMFRWDEHIIPMLEACKNSRDRALIALAWDLGPRPGELFDLTLGRFSDHQYGMKVTLYEGKKGTRSPVLVPSVPYVRQWLEDHPAPKSSNEPLWSTFTTVNQISDNRVRDIFKEVSDRATMTPPSTPTPSRMRKSSASHLASQPDVSQPHLEDHHGWDRGSQVAARYIAVFSDANDRAIAAAHGLDVEKDQPEPTGPVTCVRCQQDTPRHEERCIHCGQAMSHAAAQESEQLQEAGFRAVGELVEEYGLGSSDAASLINAVVSQQLEAKLDELDVDAHELVSSSSSSE